MKRNRWEEKLVDRIVKGKSLSDSEEEAGMGGVIASLFGKSQAWYDRVDRIQKGIAYLLAEVTAAGSELWNLISGKVNEAATAGRVTGLKYFADYKWVTDNLVEHMKKSLVTSSQAPSDQQLSLSEIYIGEVQAMVDYVKKVAPEIKAQMEADRAKIAANLSQSKLLSPSEVGEKAFVAEIEKRATALGVSAGLGLLGIVGIGLGVLLLAGRRG